MKKQWIQLWLVVTIILSTIPVASARPMALAQENADGLAQDALSLTYSAADSYPGLPRCRPSGTFEEFRRQVYASRLPARQFCRCFGCSPCIDGLQPPVPMGKSGRSPVSGGHPENVAKRNRQNPW